MDEREELVKRKELLEFEIYWLKDKKARLEYDIKKLKKVKIPDRLILFKYRGKRMGLYIVEPRGDGGGGDGYKEEYSVPSGKFLKLELLDDDYTLERFKKLEDEYTFLKNLPEDLKLFIEEIVHSTFGFGFIDGNFFTDFFVSLLFPEIKKLRELEKLYDFLKEIPKDKEEIKKITHKEPDITFSYWALTKIDFKDLKELKELNENYNKIMKYLKKEEIILHGVYPNTNNFYLLPFIKKFKFEELKEKVDLFKDKLQIFIDFIENNLEKIKYMSQKIGNFSFNDFIDDGAGGGSGTFEFVYDQGSVFLDFCDFSTIIRYDTILKEYSFKIHDGHIFLQSKIKWMDKIFNQFKEKMEFLFKTIE